MREHELACEHESVANKPRVTTLLRDVVDCIVESAHALDGLRQVEVSEQAILTQIILGARSARVFLSLALTGHYESAMAVTRMLVEDGIACAYLAENPDKAARWISGTIDPKYGEMAASVIEAHARRDEARNPTEREAWVRADTAMREQRRILDDLSHAHPERLKFVRNTRGYQLYPLFDRDALRLVAYFALTGLSQMLFFTRARLKRHGRVAPNCNIEELETRMLELQAEVTAWAETP